MREREGDFVEEEVNGRERVGGKEEGAHVENTADGRAREVDGREGAFEVNKR